MAIKNGQSRDIGNIRHTIYGTKKKSTTKKTKKMRKTDPGENRV